MSFSNNIQDKVLVDCGRSCAICHKFCGTKIELHHIKPVSEGGDDSYKNCIPLCFDCHSDAMSYNYKHPKGKKYKVSELIKHRTEWYRSVKAGHIISDNLELPPQANDRGLREGIRQHFISRYGRAPSRREIDELFAKSIIKTGIDMISDEDLELYTRVRINMKKAFFGPLGAQVTKEVLMAKDFSNFNYVDNFIGLISQYVINKPERRQLLDFLLGTSHPVLAEGGNVHIQRDSIPELWLPEGVNYYPHDKKAFKSLAEVLLGNAPIKSVSEVSDHTPTDFAGSIIVVGSSVSSPMARRFMGEIFKPVNTVDSRRYKADLKYNFAAPDGSAVVTYKIDGQTNPLTEMNWGINMLKGSLFPRRDKDGRLKTDYLLITRLPAEVKGSGDIIFIGGTHGPGCQAIDLILKKMDINELQKWSNQIREHEQYQAIFRVEDLEDIDGHTTAKGIELVEATPVDIEWAPDANWTK